LIGRLSADLEGKACDHYSKKNNLLHYYHGGEMKILLKEDIDKLGSYGSEVEVADGYGRNYLIPKGKAVYATPNNRTIIERQKKKILEKLNKTRDEAESLVNQITKEDIIFKRKVGESDKLFGSVTSQDIADFLNAKGFNIDKKKISLEESIKKIGSFQAAIKIHPDVPCVINVKVEKQEEV
jgi:large subunit ribosomal protein L9